MAFYTFVRILTYIVCSILAVCIGVGVYKSPKVSDKISGTLFLMILLLRLFCIR